MTLLTQGSFLHQKYFIRRNFFAQVKFNIFVDIILFFITVTPNPYYQFL